MTIVTAKGDKWFVHMPPGREAGISEDTIAALAEGRRPSDMSEHEEVAYESCAPLSEDAGHY